MPDERPAGVPHDHAPFGPRLLAAMSQHGPLCVGVDPHPQLLSQWGLPDSVEGVARFCDGVLEAMGGRVAAVKPQSAFFERHGSGGVAVLERLLADLRSVGTLSVLDIKRGDIGSTMGAYAQAYLEEGAPLAADAITVTPYLGTGALAPAVTLAKANGRGLFVLVLTSNPEAASVQHAGDPSVAAAVAADVAELNAGGDPVGDIGMVVGATVGEAPARLGIDLAGANGIVLAPGVGAQGATAHDLAITFAGLEQRVLVPVSRGILSAGPTPERLRATSEALSAELTSKLWS
ncbi:orotidine-5'-phosphate decarboxylase [Ornithinimicrobium ciconiae]|uniref:Orotidine 5'-phosphate decarboxylase n=1 Tax=Ornithinimicrobium ciconiae TaxID=2594265 RepID=A0A516GBI9_9MICO|nr:orotidine-5'-phosphate decarboxylase [Ornithinimicrobium ciconiae]QDO88893.1 orotidine-5'-phosphate decarboxylase [Ornithinimicrobium ciconiae]